MHIRGVSAYRTEWQRAQADGSVGVTMSAPCSNDTEGPSEHGDRLTLRPGLSIPLEEFEMRTSRSSGPGGQHVNTSDTRVELRFDVVNSPSLPEAVRARLLERLCGRLSRAGIVRVVAQGHRSQLRNREDALARMGALLSRALEELPPRVASRPTTGSLSRRRKDKQLRGALKRSRSPVDDE